MLKLRLQGTFIISIYSMKNQDRILSSKKYNLSQLSISEIWDNKLQDQSSDYQQQQYLINNLKQYKKQEVDEYGFEIISKRDKQYRTVKRIISRNQLKEDPQTHKQPVIFSSSSDRKSALAFNRQLKRKISLSKQKNPYTTKSSKIILTKPIPNIKQHNFESITDKKNRPIKNDQQTLPIKTINVNIYKKHKQIQTNLYELPIKKSINKQSINCNKKLYYLMCDDLKMEINDYNCQLVQQNPNTEYDKVNDLHKLLGEVKMKNDESSRITNYKSIAQTSWTNTDTHKIFQISYLNNNIQNRNQSASSSCKNKRRVSQFKQNSHCRSITNQRQIFQENCKIRKNMFSARDSQYTRHSLIQDDIGNRYCQYFVNGSTQAPNSEIIFTP